MNLNSTGFGELSALLLSTPFLVQEATVAATKVAQGVIVARVRSNLQGAPRYSHRGRSRIYSSEVNLNGTKSRKATGARGGPPGKFTGALSHGVGGKKVPTVAGPLVLGGVGVGGRINNIKKAPLERKFPYFNESVLAAEAQVLVIYQAAWNAALARLGSA